MNYTLCFEITLAGFKIELRQHEPDRFTVVYGRQVRDELDYPTAASELGCAIMHALACEGKLDND